jgi:hypothetical protein
MKITKRLRKLFAGLHELPQGLSGESLREFHERYLPQPSSLELARIPVRLAPRRQRRRAR